MVILVPLLAIFANLSWANPTCPPESRQERTYLRACANVKDINQSRLTFAGQSLADLNATRVALIETNFTASTLDRSTLRECRSDGAVFFGIQAKDFTIVGGQFAKADFSQVRLENCEFRGVYAPFSNFTKAELKNCKFIRSYLIGSRWSEAKFENVEFIDSLGAPH